MDVLEQQAAGATLRLMTYNVHSGVGMDGVYDVERIGRVVAGANPDVVCLQEVESNSKPRAPRKWSETHSDRQDEAIAAAAGLDFVHFMPSITAVYSPQLSTSSSEVLTADAAAGSPSQTGCYGIAIATRYPVVERRELRFKPRQDRRAAVNKADGGVVAQEAKAAPFYMDRDEQPRCALALLLAVPDSASDSASGEQDQGGGRLVWVVNTHLSHKPLSPEHARQAQEVYAWARQLQADRPAAALVLAGDLNAPPWLPFAAYSLAVGAAWGWSAAGGGWQDVMLSSNVDPNRWVTFPASVYGAQGAAGAGDGLGRFVASWLDSLTGQRSLNACTCAAHTMPRVRVIDHILVLAEGARRDQSPARCAEQPGLRCLGARVLVGPAEGSSNDAVVASDHCAVVAHFAVL